MNRRLAQRALLGCVGFSVAAPLLAATVTWDDGATTPPQLPGDGISWNDPINWDTDMAPTGVDHVVLTTELIKVQDGNAAFAGSLDAGSTNLVINGALTVGGSFYSNATITIVGEDDSPNSGAGLTIGGGGTLDGTGEIRLRRTQGPGVNPAVFSSSGVNPVIHAAEHTIRGEGFLSANLVNNGLIVAEDLDGNPGSILALGGAIQNNNIIRTTASARLRLQGSITQSATGRLIADGNIVDYLLGGITGGTLEALNGGSFLFAVDGTIGSLVNNAPMNLVAGTTGIDLFVAGSGLTNNGVITINATNLPGGTGITFQTTQLLAGSGEIVLNRSDTGGTGGAAFVTAIGAVVTQAAGHTIRGEGTISAELVNLGLVEAMDANGDGQAVLRIRNNFTGSANATNANIFRAAAGSMIDLNGRLDQTAAGRLIAADGGEIQLRAATLRGGSLETAGTGVVRLENTSTVENIVNKGVLNIPGGGSEKLLNVAGTSLTNDGVVTVNSTASGTGRIIATSSLNLAGSGEIVLVGAVTASSLTVNAGLTVTQGPDHTIRGRGQLNGITGTLINNGTVAGDSPAAMLDVNLRLAGAGLLRDVFIDGVHSPGNPQTGQPTASVPVEGHYNFGNGPGINSDNRLVIEIGGTTPGAEHDQLISTDPSNLFTIRTTGTVLDVSLIDLGNGYVPAAGDRFTIISSPNAIVGNFQQVLLPATGLGRKLQWAPVDASDPTKRVLELSAVDFLDADFDQDGDVDADDLLLWQAGFGLPAGAAKIDGDANNDGAVNGADFLIWQRQLTGPSAALPTAFAVPEPTGPGVMGLALGCGAWRRRKYHNKGQ